MAQEIQDRYETLGLKYVTDKLSPDGRLINGMMFTSRIDNCLEEIVDAVFCMVGWEFKMTNDRHPNSYARTFLPSTFTVILDNLIEAYTLLQEAKYAGHQS